MRANRDRSAALAFGHLVDHHDAGRIALPPEFVGQTLARLGVAGSDAAGPRLEVGAGTGQLTAALLAGGRERGEHAARQPGGAVRRDRRHARCCRPAEREPDDMALYSRQPPAESWQNMRVSVVTPETAQLLSG
jgi:hypothetical protein